MAYIDDNNALRTPELARLRKTSKIEFMLGVWVVFQVASLAITGGILGAEIDGSILSFWGALAGAFVGVITCIPLWVLAQIGLRILDTMHEQFAAQVVVDNWRQSRGRTAPHS
ncbi:hypothetical protein [Demequina sediminicola]|uniref:hypothetical protein n=1 Tax=Demequina sediminicola TaxID=1095026 RepID=UPI000783CD90|nr:hypothetical protein [Demequina sediminicola]